MVSTWPFRSSRWRDSNSRPKIRNPAAWTGFLQLSISRHILASGGGKSTKPGRLISPVTPCNYGLLLRFAILTCKSYTALAGLVAQLLDPSDPTDNAGFIASERTVDQFVLELARPVLRMGKQESRRARLATAVYRHRATSFPGEKISGPTSRRSGRRLTPPTSTSLSYLSYVSPGHLKADISDRSSLAPPAVPTVRHGRIP